MKRKIHAGQTSVCLPIFVLDTSSTTGAGLGPLTSSTVGLVGEYRRQGQSTWTAITLSAGTLGTWSSGGWVADGALSGAYEVGVPDAAFAASARWVAIRFRGAANMFPVTIEVELDAVDYQDGVRFGVTALPNAVAGATGGLPTVDGSNGVQIAVGTSTGKLSITSGAVTVGTNNDKTGYTASTVSDKTGYSLTQAFPANFSALAITGGGAVTAGTVSDKTGYSLTQGFPANFSSMLIDATDHGVTVHSNLDKTGYTASTVTDKAGYSLSVAPPTAAAIATAVWTTTTAGDFAVAGSPGSTIHKTGATSGFLKVDVEAFQDGSSLSTVVYPSNFNDLTIDATTGGVTVFSAVSTVLAAIAQAVLTDATDTGTAGSLGANIALVQNALTGWVGANEARTFASGTLPSQSGVAAGAVKLPTGLTVPDGSRMTVTAGSGLYQARHVNGYVSGTGLANLDAAWQTAVDATSTFALASDRTADLNASRQPVAASVAGDVSGKVIGGGSGTITGDGVRAASVTGAVGSVTGAVGSVTGNVGGSVASVTGAVGSVTGAVGSVTGNVGGNVVGSTASVTGAVGSVTGAVGSVTGNVGGNVVGSVGSVTAAVTLVASQSRVVRTANLNATSAAGATTVTLDSGAGADTSYIGNAIEFISGTGANQGGYVIKSLTSKVATLNRPLAVGVDSTTVFVINDSVSPAFDSSANVAGGGSGGPTAAQIATAVWTTTTGSDFATAGSPGKAVITNLDAAVSTRSTFAGGAVSSVTGNVGGNVTGSVGSVAGNVTGSVGSVAGNVVGSVGSVVGNVGGNVVGSTASVTAPVTVGTNNDKTNYGLSSAEHTATAAAVWGAGLPGSFGAGTAGFELATIAGGGSFPSAAAIAAASAAAILNDATHKLANDANGALPANNFPAFQLAGQPVTLPASAPGGYGPGSLTTSAIAAAVWGTAVETGFTTLNVMQLVGAGEGGAVTGADTSSPAVAALGLPGTWRLKGTTDQFGNRTNLTYNFNTP